VPCVSLQFFAYIVPIVCQLLSGVSNEAFNSPSADVTSVRISKHVNGIIATLSH